MLMYVENDFGATALDIDLLKSAKTRIYDFDRVNREAYEFAGTFDTSKLAGQPFNICANDNASIYFDFDGGLSLLIRNGAGFDVAATFNTCGESECDIDAVYCALSLGETI